ncbi:MAG: ABC transporter substrate-binding protein, partial [Pseudohongiellaceae bacterium]
TLTVLPWYEAGIESYATSLIASDRFLADRPDVARRFIEAYARAIELTWSDPDGAAQAVNQWVPEVEVDSAAATIRSIENLVFNTVSSTDGLGAFNPERLALTWNWTAQAQGIEPGSFDPETTLNRDFVLVQ